MMVYVNKSIYWALAMVIVTPAKQSWLLFSTDRNVQGLSVGSRLAAK